MDASWLLGSRRSLCIFSSARCGGKLVGKVLAGDRLLVRHRTMATTLGHPRRGGEDLLAPGGKRKVVGARFGAEQSDVYLAAPRPAETRDPTEVSVCAAGDGGCTRSVLSLGCHSATQPFARWLAVIIDHCHESFTLIFRHSLSFIVTVISHSLWHLLSSRLLCI